MKRFISIFTVLTVVVLCFVACGKQTNVPIRTEAPTTSVINLLPDGSIVTGDLGSYYAAQTTQPQATVPVQTTEMLPTAPQIDWIVDIYNTVYNNTKADAAFLGSDTLTLEQISFDGIRNDSVDSLVHTILGSVYKPQNLPLPPYAQENKFPTSIFTAADAQEATWTDLGNGQAEIRIVPKMSVNSKLGEGQGKMFNVINDIGFIFDYLPAFAYDWAEGDRDSNVITTYDGGYCTVRYDRTNMKMISAEYVMKVRVEIKNIEVMFSAHNVSVDMVYTQTFPAVG